MTNILLSLEVCENESILRGFKILNTFITIAKIILPLLIIGKTIADLTKAVISTKDDEIKSVSSKLPKRLIAGIVVFLIPTIVNYIFDTFVKFEETASSFASCSTCLNNAKECDDLIKIAHDQALAAKKDLSQEYEFQIDLNKQKERAKQDEQQGGTEDEETPTGQQPVNPTTVGNGKYFDSNDVTKISGLSEEEFINVLQNSTAYKGKAKVYIPLAHDLILAEKNHSVNAFYLIGLYSYESGWLGSTLTKKCNNIGGVRYYGRTYGNGKKQTNCWNNYAGFDSIAEFIDFHSNMLQTKYLTPGADHYNGTSVAAVAKDYGSGNGIDTIIRIATNVSGGNLSK